MEELLAEVCKAEIVYVPILELLILESKAGTVNLICKYLIGTTIILVTFDALASRPTSRLNGHTFCDTAKNNSLGYIGTIVCHVSLLKMGRN